MKLSFSIPSSKSTAKPKPSQGFNNEASSSQHDNQSNHEYLTEFDASKTLANSNQPKKIVIPPKQNEWRPHSKMQNLDLPLRSSSSNGVPETLQFEPESSSDVPPPPESESQISYGLNLRQSGEKRVVDDDGPNSIDAIALKKLKSDLDDLPDDEGFEQFDEVPVDGFGAALLAGYGWREGMGVGKNAKEDVKVVEYTRRTAKEGLGFFSDNAPNGKVTDKKREKESNNNHNENSGFAIGKEVRIIGGREMGLKGRVVEVVPGGRSLVLRLSRNEEVVKVRVDDVAELGSVEEEKCLRKLKELKIQASKDDDSSRKGDRKSKDLGSERKESRKSSEIKHERVVHKEERRRSDRVLWLASHIRVRVISKEFKGGRFYLKKGEVIDVVGPTTCDISMDDGREIVQGVDQDILETAVPRRGGPVLVLCGKHKGTYGSLVEKDSESETAVVQDADTHELLHVRLEQIAEYIGDPSYIGY